MDADGLDGGGYLLVYDRRLELPGALRVDVVDGELVVTGTDAGRAV